MKPVRFSCEAVVCEPPEVIAGQVLDLSRWPEFQGHGILPGIHSAEFETRTPEIVGSRIRVKNTDGSTHVEEVVAWEPRHHLELRMGEFSRPLSRLASHFIESWDFTARPPETLVIRSFDLFPRSRLARPILCLIAVLLKRAIAQHLRQMKESAMIEPEEA